MAHEFKRGIAFITMFCIMFTTAFVSNSTTYRAFAAGAKVILNDTFEDEKGNEDLNGWIFALSDGSKVLGEKAADPLDSSNTVVRFYRDPSATTTECKATRDFGQVLKGKVQIEYKIMFDTATGVLHHLGGVADSGLSGIHQFMAFNDAYWVKNGSFANDAQVKFPNVAVETDKWQNVKIEVDTEANKYTMYFNDQLVADDFTMLADAYNGVKGIIFQDRKGNMYVDDMKITVGEAVLNYTRISSSKYTVSKQDNLIDDVKFETTVDEFLKNITFISGAVYGIYQADGVTKSSNKYITDGDKLVVSTPDNSSKQSYTINVEAWNTSMQLMQVVRNSVILLVGSNDALVANEKVKIDSANLDVMPIVKDDRTLVPVRFIAEGFNAKVDWDGDTSTITVSYLDKIIKMQLGSKVVSINGQEKELDVPAQTVNDRTLIPLRSMIEAMGKQVFWDDRGLIVIGDNANPFDSITKQPWIEEIFSRFGVVTHTKFDFSVVKNLEATPEPGLKLYIAPNGSDTNDGSIDKPFATLDSARNAIRAVKKSSGLPKGGVTVYLRGGSYSLNKTFALTKEDSGSYGSPILYTNYPNEQPIIGGGTVLDSNAFTAVKDKAIIDRLPSVSKNNVVQIDLKTQGIDKVDPLQWIGFSRPYEAGPSTIYFNGKAATMARWPNDEFVRTGKVIDVGSKPRNSETPDRGFTFEYADNRPSTWKNISDVWMYGLWCFGYAQSVTQIESIDTAAKTIKTVYPHHYGAMPGKEYYYYNVLEELDIPGEFYIDRTNSILYFYPPEDMTQAVVTYPQLKEDMVKLDNVSYMTFRGLTLESSRLSGIVATESSKLLIDNCVIRELGNAGVLISSSKSSGVQNSCIYDVGGRGVSIKGGDRETLTPNGNFVDNNHIYNFAQVLTTYNAGVEIGGVGTRISHNIVHDGPQQAFNVVGGGTSYDAQGANDVVLEYNDVYNMLEPQVDDSGSFYSYLDGAQRGMVIRYNFFHHFSKQSKADLSSPPGAIYLDNWTSGYKVYGNIFYSLPVGNHFNGGGYNTVTNNVFVNVVSPAWLHTYTTNKPKEFWDRLTVYPYDSGIWAEKYPYLKDIDMTNDGNKVFTNNEVSGNLFYKTVKNISGSASLKVENNYKTNENAGFVDELGMNFKLSENSIVFEKITGFKNIPTEEIGLK